VDYTEKQKEIIRYENRHRPLITICEGAVRSGKTIINIDLFNIHIAEKRYKHVDYIITGYTIGSIERNVIKPWSERWGIRLRLDQHNRFELYGNRVNCFGADKGDSYKHMTGLTSYGWYGTEVTLQNSNTINEAFDRTSGDGYRIFWDMNPDYPEHPIKINYINRSGEELQTGRERIKAWHFQLEDNTFLTEEYIENLKKSTPSGVWYDRRIKGLWVAAEGLVYEDWNPEVHIVEPFKIPDEWQRVIGIDWGYTNPFVALWGAVDPDGRLYIYREYYKNQVLIREHAKKLHRMAYQDGWKDEKGKHPREYIFNVADHDAQDNAELKKYGINTRPAQKDVQIGIQKVAERLKVRKDGKPRLMIFRDCVNLKREMGMYRWTERKEGKPVKEEPLKVDDHGPDALRYMVMELDNERSHGIYI